MRARWLLPAFVAGGILGYVVGRPIVDVPCEKTVAELAHQVRHVAIVAEQCYGIVEDHWRRFPHSAQPGSAVMVEGAELQRRTLRRYVAEGSR